MIKLSSGGEGGCGSAPGLTSGTHTIQSGGKSRSFILRVPDNYDNNRPYRLIFAFHWRGGTAQDVASGGTSGNAWSYYGQQEQSDNTAILVAPQGLDNGWANAGGEDITFVDDMIRRIEAGLCVNPAQRFATGFSWGGGMSYALACARANDFRAVAVIAGARSAGAAAATSPSRTSASTASATPFSTSRKDGPCATGSSATTAALPRARPSPRRAAERTSPPRTRAAVPGTRSSGPRSTEATSPARSTLPRRKRRRHLDQGRDLEVLRTVRVTHPRMVWQAARAPVAGEPCPMRARQGGRSRSTAVLRGLPD